MAHNIAVFLDRDGTLNEERGYLNHVDRMELIDGAAEAVALLRNHGLKTIVVTNQAGVARGYYPEKQILLLHEKLQRLLQEGGAELDAIYYCPHHPDVGEPPYRRDCDCRKPKLGMIHTAEKDLGVDAKRSYMVGDKLSDVEFGKRAGCISILVLTGYGKGELEHNREKYDNEPDHIAEDILDAAQWIVNDLEKQQRSSA